MPEIVLPFPSLPPHIVDYIVEFAVAHPAPQVQILRVCQTFYVVGIRVLYHSPYITSSIDSFFLNSNCRSKSGLHRRNITGLSDRQLIAVGLTKLAAFRHIKHLCLNSPLPHHDTNTMSAKLRLSSALLYLNHIKESVWTGVGIMPALRTVRIGGRAIGADSWTVLKNPLDNWTVTQSDALEANAFTRLFEGLILSVRPIWCRYLNPDEPEPLLNPWLWRESYTHKSSAIAVHSHFAHLHTPRHGAIIQNTLNFLYLPERTTHEAFDNFLTKILTLFAVSRPSSLQSQERMSATSVVISGSKEQCADWVKRGPELRLRYSEDINPDLTLLRIEVRERKDMPTCPGCQNA